MREEQSLSTCSKTQCTVLKTVEGGIFPEWAKSRLQGIRDRQMKAPGRRRKWGFAEASPGELPGTDRIPTRQDTLKTELGGVVEGGCSCRQLFPTRSSDGGPPDAVDIPAKGARCLS